MTQETKICKECKLPKPLTIEHFGKWSSFKYNTSGFNTTCKPCANKKANLIYHSDPAANLRQKIASDLYQRNNRKKTYAKQQAYRERVKIKTNWKPKGRKIYYAVNIFTRELIFGNSTEISLKIDSSLSAVSEAANKKEHIRGYHIFKTLEEANTWIVEAPAAQHVSVWNRRSYVMRNLYTQETIMGTLPQLRLTVGCSMSTLHRWADRPKKKAIKGEWVFHTEPL